MARQLERDHAVGVIHAYSAYESIGIAVQSAMFRPRLKVKDRVAVEMIQLASRGLLSSPKAGKPGQTSLGGIPDLAVGAGCEPVATGQCYLAFTADALRTAVKTADM